MECIVVLIRVHSRQAKSRDLFILGQRICQLVPNDTVPLRISEPYAREQVHRIVQAQRDNNTMGTQLGYLFRSRKFEKLRRELRGTQLNNAFHKSCYYEEGMESASYLVGTMINCKEISFLKLNIILSWEIKKSTI